MAVQQPAVVNPTTGDISVHGREGVYLTLGFQLADGSLRDVAAASLFFEVEDVLRVALAAGPSADKRILQLTRDQVAACAGAPRQFVVVDESGTIPDVLWRASLFVEGFTVQPA